MKDLNKTIKARVKQILIDFPFAKDDNSKLFECYYNRHHTDKILTMFSFFGAISRNEMPSTESLARLSRQLQEQNENLRTQNWYERKNMEIPVQRELGYNV